MSQASVTALSYQITEAQFIAAQRLHVSFKSPAQKLLRLITCALSLFIIAASLYKGPYWLALAGVVGLCHPWISWALTSLPQLLNTYRNTPALHQQFRAELRDGQLLTGMDSEGSLPWNHIIAWAEDEHSLLLYLQPQYFLIFPKATDPDSRFITPLREQLVKNSIQKRFYPKQYIG